jgi:hypothetical protein
MQNATKFILKGLARSNAQTTKKIQRREQLNETTSNNQSIETSNATNFMTLTLKLHTRV